VTSRALFLVPVALLALSGCSGSPASDDEAAGSTTERSAGDDLGGTLTIFAAASLTDVFDQLKGDFQEAHPLVDVQINYGPSSGLAQSITQGAPADVFASANEAQMQVVADAGMASDLTIFTSNVLQIAVPAGNPGGVTGLADFAREDLTLAVCAPEVPCGAAAEQVFEDAGIDAKPDSQEEDVRAALTKVELGEVEAALVYATDVVAAGDKVEGVEFPEAEDEINNYPIAVLSDAPHSDAAQAWIQLVRSEAGQQVLADAGFRAP
jgi:molybdate transport system substrate-binding protein